jgi:hypothetical protein
VVDNRGIETPIRTSRGGISVNRPFADHSVETLLNVYGAYHLARLQTDPVLRDLASSFSGAQHGLAERARAYAASQIRLMTALGRWDARLAQLEETVQEAAEETGPETGGTLLARQGNDSRRVLVRRSLRAIRRAVGTSAAAEVLSAIDDLQHAIGSDPGMDLASGAVSAAVDQVRAALNEFEEMKSDADAAFASLEMEKARWFREYRESFHETQLRARGRARGLPGRFHDTATAFSQGGLRLVT